ncbi:YlxR family protein [Zafaria cholistanensis]|nr:YlxR family protein [Zafaria cholistanensis]
MSVQHQPQRTCVGCRRKADQNQLMRWVAAARDGRYAVVADPHRRMSGRGAWLHPTPECAALAVKRKAFTRAFRVPVESSTFDPAVLAAGASPTGTDADTTVQPESGSEI